MKSFDNLILDVVLIIMPIMMYLLYSAYSKITNKDEEKLIFVLSLITQYYLIIKYGRSIFDDGYIFLINIPLLITYYKKDNRLIILFTILLIIYMCVHFNIIILLIKYIVIYVFSKNIKEKKFIIFFSIISVSDLFIFKSIYEVISSGAIMYVISLFVVYLLDKGENMINLHVTLKELEKESDVKKRLFQITHEIKNPIAVCKGYLDMYDLKKDCSKFIPILKEEINRTLILLEDFLAMNRQKINKEILDINMLLDDVLNNIQILLKNKKIDVIYENNDDEVYINGDYNRLMQVFINIFKNSIEALENIKRPKIKIWSKIDDNYINIFIKDNGVGINSEVIDKIKEPFYTTKIKGSGLGVSLSDEIIKAHNGILKYESCEGDYTLVKIKIPLEVI